MSQYDSAKVHVNIMGRSYTLRGELDSNYMQVLAKKVNDRIEELKEISPGADGVQLAILCALNFADELEQNKGGVGPAGIEEKTQKLISLLERGIIGDKP